MVAMANGASSVLVTNGAAPCEGTKAYPFNLDFTAANAYLIDLTQQYNQKQFTTLQTAYIDNADNDQIFELICNVTNQRIVAPPHSQGFYAMLQPTPPRFTVQTSGQFVIEIILLNFYIPPQVWFTNGSTVDIPALDPLIVGGNLSVQNTPPVITPTDGSGTITAGGTAQPVLANNNARKRFILSNPDTATETLYFCFGTAASGKIPLLPGATWDENGSNIVGAALFLFAATTGHPFTLYSA